MKLIQAKGPVAWLQIYWLYRNAFPAGERKPFSIIRKMQKMGRTDVWYAKKEGGFAGFAATINGNGRILIDYLAVDKKKRCQGIGTEILKLLRTRYEGMGVFLEIERVCADAPNAAERIRRKQFYLAAGMQEMHVFARVFGVEMELLGWNCTMDFEEYRAFYRDSYSEFAANHIKPLEQDII
ncbi:MAG: GNAT family N-acetyltransferase [Ruminococcaceae bacterium]|nr:GNAT family N-acetyltransferase [Oscillospiraceae bacterium]